MSSNSSAMIVFVERASLVGHKVSATIASLHFQSLGPFSFPARRHFCFIDYRQHYAIRLGRSQTFPSKLPSSIRPFKGKQFPERHIVVEFRKP
jgi:hypothetical protein